MILGVHSYVALSTSSSFKGLDALCLSDHVFSFYVRNWHDHKVSNVIDSFGQLYLRQNFLLSFEYAFFKGRLLVVLSGSLSYMSGNRAQVAEMEFWLVTHWTPA